MTTVFPISSALPSAQTAAPNNPTTDTTKNNQLNQDTFLTLLVAQLKYQDPMNPADRRNSSPRPRSSPRSRRCRRSRRKWRLRRPPARYSRHRR